MNEQPLTMSEKALLQCLAAAAGETVEYNTLICEGLGFLHPGDAGELLIRTRIHNLRAKLPEGTILTVHASGRVKGGYQLAGEVLARLVRFA